MLERLSLNVKIFAGFGVTIAFLAFLTSAAYFGQHEIQRKYEEVSIDLVQMHDFSDLRSSINAERLDIAMLLTESPHNRRQWKEDLNRRLEHSRAVIERLSVSLRNPERIARFNEFKALYKTFVTSRIAVVVPLIEQGRLDEARRIFAGIQFERHRMIREILKGLSEEVRAESLNKLDSTRKRSNLYTAASVAFGSLTVLTSILMALFMRRTLNAYLSQRASAEEKIKDSEARFRILAETIEDVFWMSTPGVGRMLYISPAYEKIWGMSRDSLYESPKSFLERVHPEDTGILDKTVREYHSKGRPYTCEYRIVKDGAVQWILERGFPVFDEKGGLLFMTGTCSVITERKKIETLIRESEAELKEAQRIAHVGSWDWDKLTDTVKWSEELYRIAGLAPEEEPPNYYVEHHRLYTPESMARINSAVERALTTGEPYRLELELIRRDGTTRWIDATGEVKRGVNGEITGLHGTVIDITGRKTAAVALEKTARELEASNKELEQFAYIASHDLQEPLRMIASFLQLLENRYKGRLDENADEYIKYAVDGASRLQRMINDLLDFSRVQTRGKPFEKTEGAKLVEQALSNLKMAIRETGTEVTCGPLPSVHVDGSQLSRVFQNLISNAMKFRRPEAPPRITISAADAGTEWLFSVSDNGIGIEPQYLEGLFKVFQRLHGPKYPGTGIGLAICRKIVERHGGRIWAESEHGEGAAFKFTIPKRE